MSISNMARIREMDADELRAHAREIILQHAVGNGTPESSRELEQCRKNYSALTGKHLSLIERSHAEHIGTL